MTVYSDLVGRDGVEPPESMTRNLQSRQLPLLYIYPFGTSVKGHLQTLAGTAGHPPTSIVLETIMLIITPYPYKLFVLHCSSRNLR